MTGKASGNCMLRIPDNQDEPISGFAGGTGWPVSFGGQANQKKDQMPGGDRTGSRGMGPGRGRAAGYCMRYGAPGFSNRSPDSDSRTSRFPGGRDRFYQAGGREEQMETLQARAKQMEIALDGIRQRIQELETGKGEA